jgi:hypothetical protein
MMLRRKNDAKKKEKPPCHSGFVRSREAARTSEESAVRRKPSQQVWNGHSLRQAQGKLCPLPLTLMLTLLRWRAAVDFGWRSASSAAKKA